MISLYLDQKWVFCTKIWRVVVWSMGEQNKQIKKICAGGRWDFSLSNVKIFCENTPKVHVSISKTNPWNFLKNTKAVNHDRNNNICMNEKDLTCQNFFIWWFVKKHVKTPIFSKMQNFHRIDRSNFLSIP